MSQKTNLVVFLILLSACVFACTRQTNTTIKHELAAFGTLIEIDYFGVNESQAEKITRDIDSMFQQQHRDWHAWQKGQLRALNEAIETGSSIETSESILELIQLGKQFEIRSKGLFNPAIGKLLKLWRFQQDEPSGPPPDDEVISLWLDAKPSTLDLQVEGAKVRSQNKNVSLDFGGFAKGYSVGNAVELIETKGIKNFIVNAGGDLCTRGSRGKRPWQIGIRDPDGSGIFAKISVKTNGCIFTSGGYERYFWHNGRRYHHILDPRTGYPASGSASATVITEDPTLADAASTAIFVAGPAYLEEISKSMGIRYFLLIDEEGNVFISDQLLDQIEFIERPKSVTKISLEHL